MTIELMLRVRQEVCTQHPLIHCITNPISVNDCANAVLAVGAQPIMAEHPEEVAAITRRASALLVNLGCVTDSRLAAMQVSGRESLDFGIPCVIDLVGVGCSLLRLQFARKFIGAFHPAVIKGNLSELKAFAGTPTAAAGVDAAADDTLTPENTERTLDQLSRLARRTGAVILATGETDIVANGDNALMLCNGTPMLSRVTGTGCVAGALTAVGLAAGDGMTAVALAVSMLGISGELAAETARGTGSFRVALMDALNTLENNTFTKRLHIEHRPLRCT